VQAEIVTLLAGQRVLLGRLQVQEVQVGSIRRGLTVSSLSRFPDVPQAGQEVDVEYATGGLDIYGSHV
jgi:hypothetical protein